MPTARDILDQVTIGPRVRQNHALEHAAISILSPRHPQTTFTGRSIATGFYVWGDVEGDEVRRASDEALERLRTSEPEMAIHPRCGTNLAVAAVMAGLSAVGAGSIPPQRNRYSRGVLASMVALAFTQPVGFFVQRHATTLTPKRTLRVTGITPKRGLFGSGYFVHTLHVEEETA